MTTTKSVSMFSKLMEKSSNFVMEGVKNLVVKKHDLPVTKVRKISQMILKRGKRRSGYDKWVRVNRGVFKRDCWGMG